MKLNNLTWFNRFIIIYCLWNLSCMMETIDTIPWRISMWGLSYGSLMNLLRTLIIIRWNYECDRIMILKGNLIKIILFLNLLFFYLFIWNRILLLTKNFLFFRAFLTIFIVQNFQLLYIIFGSVFLLRLNVLYFLIITPYPVAWFGIALSDYYLPLCFSTGIKIIRHFF